MWPVPTCPNGHGPLGKNGTYTRDYVDAQGSHRLPLQRYRCRDCAQTWTLLPTFAVPFSAYAEGLRWAVAIWHQDRGWSWARIQAWLVQRGLMTHRRTLQRWAARGSQQISEALRRLLIWVGDLHWHRHIDVWGRTGMGSAWRGWQRLWQGIQRLMPAWRSGAMWDGPTLLGLWHHTECRLVRDPPPR